MTADVTKKLSMFLKVIYLKVSVLMHFHNITLRRQSFMSPLEYKFSHLKASSLADHNYSLSRNSKHYVLVQSIIHDHVRFSSECQLFFSYTTKFLVGCY